MVYGRNVQWSRHKGKCGACGDEYGISNPRFVSPGVFASNPPIVKAYTEGELIEETVKITANHKGYFIFRVAELVNPPITQADLDKNKKIFFVIFAGVSRETHGHGSISKYD